MSSGYILFHPIKKSTKRIKHKLLVSVPTSGFAYSLEALSEDEDADEEETDDTERSPITQEQLAAALQVKDLGLDEIHFLFVEHACGKINCIKMTLVWRELCASGSVNC